MASIFTYDPDPPQVSSPWSTPQSTTPKLDISQFRSRSASGESSSVPHILSLDDVGIAKLDPEPQDGPTEYKLHLLLRPRTSAAVFPENSSVSTQNDPRPAGLCDGPIVGSNTQALRPAAAPSTSTRQDRLQHLTTQLLWRLQQSSPYHSSSSSNLVLPVLPEATPKLGVPNKPAQLLPGLEESQGALYEIGVTDDGSFVGLTDDEMEESVTNLRAMAASLGCYVEVLRKVLVGRYEPPASASDFPTGHVDQNLWVIEALVRPELDGISSNISQPVPPGGSNSVSSVASTKEFFQSNVEQMRVSLVGSSTSGKSTLLGVLTSSVLDNGRGKTRLGLLRHRHEISSGVTSSVAQELIGYSSNTISDSVSTELPALVNFGVTNVVSWNDIHSLTGGGRLVFISDSPGRQRYSKSSIRTLIGWRPHWTVCCISASISSDRSEGGPVINTAQHALPFVLDLSVTHLLACLQLRLPVVIVVTKMDMADKTSLRAVLTKVLSVVKAAGRKPIIVPSTNDMPSNSRSQLFSGHTAQSLQGIDTLDMRDISSAVNAIKMGGGISAVPIVLVSSVTGSGISKLHALLCSLPFEEEVTPTSLAAIGTRSVGSSENIDANNSSVFHIDETFAIPVSRVYSPAMNADQTDQGVVLCGRVSHGRVRVGDLLELGPFGNIEDVNVSYADMSQGESEIGQKPTPQFNTPHLWATVKVVSIRNLRLPVQCLLVGQVGTIGVSLCLSSEQVTAPGSAVLTSLAKARRGMVLLSHLNASGFNLRVTFSALFSLKIFEDPTSPPLIIGGQAMAYVNAIRAPVKVTVVEKLHESCDADSLTNSTATLAMGDEHGTGERDNEDGGFFDYDGDDESGATIAPDTNTDRPKDGLEAQVRIGFALLRWPEVFASGDQVLIMPSVSSTLGGPVHISDSSFTAHSLERHVSSESPAAFGFTTSNLLGFVGTVV